MQLAAYICTWLFPFRAQITLKIFLEEESEFKLTLTVVARKIYFEPKEPFPVSSGTSDASGSFSKVTECRQLFSGCRVCVTVTESLKKKKKIAAQNN